MFGHTSGWTLLSLPPHANLTRSGWFAVNCSVRVGNGMRARPARTPRGPELRPPAQASEGSGSVSGRMSIRQPVRRAASRAFCPSLPIASDSW
jgi:hypothetical protein